MGVRGPENSELRVVRGSFGAEAPRRRAPDPNAGGEK